MDFCKAVQQGEFCALCYSGVKGRRSFRGHYGWRRDVGLLEVEMSRFKKKGQTAKTANGGSWDWKKDRLLKEFPTLCDYLSIERFDDGAPRETLTLLVFVEDGSLKVCASDREEGLVTFLTAGSLEALFAALEAGLCEGGLDWRRSRGKQRR